MLRCIKRWLRPTTPLFNGPELRALPELLALNTAQRVLVFAPHPDDESLGCGGTLALLAQRCAVKVVLVTDGSGAGGLPEGSAFVRQQEFCNALSLLGVIDFDLLKQPDGAFEATPSVMSRLTQLLESFKPNWVFLPSVTDPHPDHAKLSLALLPLCWQQQSVETILQYEVWAPVQASHVVDITAVETQKREAIRAHATALTCADYEEATLGLNRFRGLYLGKGKLAEAFLVKSTSAVNCRP